MDEIFNKDSVSGAVSKGVGLLKGFGWRVVVHLAALVVGIIAYISFSGPWGFHFSDFAVVLIAYAGVITLFPRNIDFNALWLIPNGIGLAQFFLLLFMGFPWQLALLWGGMQTWIQRLLQSAGKMGLEWSSVPIQLIGLGFFVSISKHAGVAITPLWTFPVLAAVGCGIQLIYKSKRNVPIHRRLMQKAIASLQQSALNGRMPTPLAGPVSFLTNQAEHYLFAYPSLGKDGFALAQETDDAARKLDMLLSRISVLNFNAQTDRTFNLINALNEKYSVGLRNAPPMPEANLDNLPENDMDARMDAFLRLSLKLAAKKPFLPENLRPHLDGIQKSTANIVDCMKKDPQDIAPGNKFLSRYLPSAHTVVDEHIRLSKQGFGNKDIADALDKSASLIARLEDAFAKEHTSLLQNDTMDFNAELNVLDKLLKMKGS